VFDFGPFPDAPAGVVDAYVKPTLFPRCFANGLSPAKGAVLAATQRPLSTQALGELSGRPAWKVIPSWAVIGTADNVIPKADQLAMAHRAHSHVRLVDGAPHLSMISNPGIVTRVIERAADATG
jgi:pimeloyl-ACP methyl ester carboxylesterase